MQKQKEKRESTMIELEDRGMQRVIEGNTELQRSEPTQSDAV